MGVGPERTVVLQVPVAARTDGVAGWAGEGLVFRAAVARVVGIVARRAGEGARAPT